MLYRLGINHERADAHRTLQLALDQAPEGEPQPRWVEALYAIGNHVGDEEIGALDARDREALERWAEGVDDWVDGDGRPLIVLRPMP